MQRKTDAVPVTVLKEIGFSQDVVLHEGDVAISCRVVYVLSFSVPFRFRALNA